MKVYSNNTGNNSILGAFIKYSQGVKKVQIATAFFSNYQPIEKLARQGVNIKLIVRLSSATSGEALYQISRYENVLIRAYTATTFHPKLFLFGDEWALLGSANMTNAGFVSNQEISISISSNDEGFESLPTLFQGYWDHAKPLNKRDIDDYRKLLRHKDTSAESKLQAKILEKFGDFRPPSNIVEHKTYRDKSEAYIVDYDRQYQEFLLKYSVVKNAYLSTNKRKISEDLLPLRIEIDQFFNYIRERLTSKDSYNNQPVRSGGNLNNFVRETAESWFDADFPYLDTVIKNYSIIRENFRSPESIRAMSLDDMFTTLLVVHSFYEQFRHHAGGGTEPFRKAFIELNTKDKLQEKLIYLLFGEEKFTTRMAECIYGRFKTAYMADSSIQELLGWLNLDEIPIRNSRTMKALRYLGAIDYKVY